MPQDTAEILVGANGNAYVAPVGTAAPTDIGTALNAAFIELGYITEDGATLTDSKDVEDINAWQSLYPVRRIVTNRSFTVNFGLRQWNDVSIKLAFGGGTVTAAGTPVAYTYNPPAPEFLDERAMVLQWADGAKDYRLWIPKGIVMESVESSLNRTSTAILPITFAALPEGVNPIYRLITDDPSFA